MSSQIVIGERCVLHDVMFVNQTGVYVGQLGEPAEPSEPTADEVLSKGILSSLQACERLLSASETGDHVVKTKLDECLQQLSALKFALALHGIVYEIDFFEDPIVLKMIGRLKKAQEISPRELFYDAPPRAWLQDGYMTIIHPNK